MIATLSSSLMRASRERDGGLYRPLPREGKQGSWPEARALGYPRPRADRGGRSATPRRRTHRPTLAPRRGRAAGGLAGRLRRRGRHLPGDRAAPAGRRLSPPRAAPRARAAPPSRAPWEPVTGVRAKTLTPRELAWI